MHEAKTFRKTKTLKEAYFVNLEDYTEDARCILNFDSLM